MAMLLVIIPISDQRRDAAGVMRRVVASDEPVVITQRGRAAAVLVSAEAYARTHDELEIMRTLARGDAEIAQGRGPRPSRKGCGSSPMRVTSSRSSRSSRSSPHRELPVSPYSFFHRGVDGTVWIVAVWHARQLTERPDAAETG